MLRQLVVPVYMFLCISLGGSAQAIWGNLVLQLLAVLLIAWAVVLPVATLNSASRSLLLLVVLSLGLVGLQLIPLPPEIWTQLPGRRVLVGGYVALDQQLPWLPISMAPYDTLSAALFLLPPVAVVLGVVRLRAYREIWVASAILAATISAILLGYLQITSGKSNDSGFYLYESTNLGSAVGFFANRNHMATLLLISIPFSVALIARAMVLDRKRGVPLIIVAGAMLPVIFAGIAINGSLAGVVLSVPVLFASALLLPGASRFRAWGFSAVAVTLIAALLYLTNSPVQAELAGTDTASFTSRAEIWNVSLSAVGALFPVGSGFGTFELVYRAFEDPISVRHYYVNHAHNDYLQIMMEGGVFGALLVGLLLVWWIAQCVRVWMLNDRLFARAASIASGLIILHSLVDYPLRTTAIAAIFACCLAMLARRSLEMVESPVGKPSGESRPARHLRLG